MNSAFLNKRTGFALVELMILGAAVALLALVAITHFNHAEPIRSSGSMDYADNAAIQYAIQTYPGKLAGVSYGNSNRVAGLSDSSFWAPYR